MSELERTEKWEYYAARICAVIWASQGAKKVDESKYLCKFTVKGKDKKKMMDESVNKEQRVQEAKAFWGAFFAVHGNRPNPNALKEGRSK